MQEDEEHVGPAPRRRRGSFEPALHARTKGRDRLQSTVSPCQCADELEGQTGRVSPFAVCHCPLPRSPGGSEVRKENENFVLPSGWLGHETPEVRAGKREGEKADPGGEQGCRAALP